MNDNQRDKLECLKSCNNLHDYIRCLKGLVAKKDSSDWWEEMCNELSSSASSFSNVIFKGKYLSLECLDECDWDMDDCVETIMRVCDNSEQEMDKIFYDTVSVITELLDEETSNEVEYAGTERKDSLETLIGSLEKQKNCLQEMQSEIHEIQNKLFLMMLEDKKNENQNIICEQ